MTILRFLPCSLVAFALMGFVAARAEEPTDSIAGYDMLDELIVTGEVPVLQSDGAKTVYNVQEDPAADSSTVLDMLRKVPLVTVDGQGNVRLNGQQNFKFQVNGIDNPMLTQYADQVLKAMPAASVQKIVVITEPGAKEDAEGGAGIINIVLAGQKSQDGAAGNIGANVSTRDYGVNGYAITRKNKVTISANAAWQSSFADQRNENSALTRYLNSPGGYFKTNTRQWVTFDYVSGNLNLSWEADSLNLFTAGASVTYVDGKANSLLSSNSRYDNDGNLLWMFEQDGNASIKNLNITANTSYRHNFGRESNHLIFSYFFNYGRNRTGLERFYTKEQNYTVDFPFTSSLNSAYTREHTAQIDYANDFATEKHLFESGVKGIFRRNGAITRYKNGLSSSDANDNLNANSNLSQPQDVYAAYASYTGTFGNLVALGGVRYEHSSLGIKFREGMGDDFTIHLNDVVPNAALTWKFSAMSNLRLAYQMRISRPSINQVNPYHLYVTPYEIQTGNPNLKSEQSNKLSLNYSRFGRVVGGSVGIEQTFVNNAITGFIYYLPDTATGNPVLYNSYANAGTQRITALTGFINWNIIPHMSLNLSGRVAYNYLKAPSEGYQNDGFDGNLNVSWNYTLQEVWKFNFYGGWSSRNVSLQGYNSGWTYYGISASRDLLADKSLTVALSAGNFFTPKADFTGRSVTKEAITMSTWTNKSNWRAAISISWKFGSLNTRVKETGANLRNDDASSASNSSKGSGL